MSEMVERVARAIMRAQWLAVNGYEPDDQDANWRGWEDRARAAITEMREPTDAMLQLACDSHKVGEPMAGTALQGSPKECPHIKNRRRIWYEMIDEALR